VDALVIATDVESAVLGWETSNARAIGAITATELRILAAAGEFADGSMGPKVEAACRFAESGGRAVITSVYRLRNALDGTAGTVITS